MKEHLQRLKNRTAWLWAHSFIGIFAISFLPLFFRTNGYSLMGLACLYLFLSLGVLFLLPLIKKINLRRSLLIGYLCYAGCMLSIFWGSSWISYVGYALFGAATYIFFWIPFNYVFFQTSKKETNSTDSAFFFNSTAILGTFVPLLGAAVIGHLGYRWLFGIAFIYYLILGTYVYFRLPDETHTSNFRLDVQKFKGLKTIACLEGSLQYFSGVILAIYALLFFQDAANYSHYLSYLGLIGFIIALFISRRSDHQQKRLGYLFVLYSLMCLAIISLATASSTVHWMIVVGIFMIINGISLPLRSAVSMDVKVVDMGFWKTREFFLNLGRVATLAISALFFYLHLYWPIFVIFALIATVYPFLVRYKFKELK